MILLRTSYRYGVFLEYFFKLQLSSFWRVYMVKFCHQKTLILRCIPPPNKKINLPPPEKSRTPWQETQVTGNNFNPLRIP